MHPILKREFDKAMALAESFSAALHYQEAFKHLERAHVIGQRYAWPHTVNHWQMLKAGFRMRDWREVFGQVARIALAAIGSLLGRAPLGNTGRANVGILTPMPIPDDIQQLFRQADL